jgi:hypothetical protein
MGLLKYLHEWVSTTKCVRNFCQQPLFRKKVICGVFKVYEIFMGLIHFTDQTFLGFCVQNFGPRMAKFVVNKKEASLKERQNK